MEGNQKSKYLLDSALGHQAGLNFFSVNAGSGATLFSRGKRINCFFTQDSRLYVIPGKYGLGQKSTSSNRSIKQLDGLSSRIVSSYMKYRPAKKKDKLTALYLKKIALIKNSAEEARLQAQFFLRDLTLTKVWNISMIGAILFGMVSMSFIYRYLGSGASADSVKAAGEIQSERTAVPEKDYPQTKVLGIQDEKEKIKEGIYFESVLNDLIESRKDEFEQKIREMVKGYPIEEMVPYIAEKDPIVAAFLISIARKESSWGVRVPVLNDQDCYNYWGYRGIRKLMGTGGHTCFNSRKDAVDTVAKRIEFLVSNKKLDTPAKMVIWKCGSDCNATGGQAAANKWIADVEYYFKKLNDQG